MPHKDDIERFKDYEFITPPLMVDNELALELEKAVPYDPEKGWVPAYIFSMVNVNSQAVMGSIDLRVGLTEKLRVFGGHIGYDVGEPFRGNRYAARSCRILLPFARRLGINPLIITCAPDNIASLKTIESLGAKLVATNEVEIEPGLRRWTNVYHLDL